MSEQRRQKRMRGEFVADEDCSAQNSDLNPVHRSVLSADLTAKAGAK